MSLYVQKIMEIPSLTDNGSQQLATDISYLINMLSALDISIDPNLEKINSLLNIPKDKFEIQSIDPADVQLATMLSNIRGIKL